MHQDNQTITTLFHPQVSLALQGQIEQRHSVVLLGMKRVGISNFLRHFLESEPPARATAHPERRIVVDLNNLIERSIYAFWVLTLKKVVDEILSGPYEIELENEAKTLFTQSIQLHDSFFTLHALQRLLAILAGQGIFVTFFFLRFDRLQTAMTAQFLHNLVGLRDAVPGTVYVVTSHRPLHQIAPEVFPRIATQGFFSEIYVPPLNTSDTQRVLESLSRRYSLNFPPAVKTELIRLCGGHVQLQHQGILKLKNEPQLQKSVEGLAVALQQDETVQFLCEEIWSSLTAEEQEVGRVVAGGHRPTEPTNSDYLLQTGILNHNGSELILFSPLLQEYVQQRLLISRKNTGPEFTKKEHLFFEILLNSLGELVERDNIIEHVWPDEFEYGISDWAVDRLAARVRRKLSAQTAPYTLKTVVSRGYKLVATADSSKETDT